MAPSGNNPRGMITEINVTPMVDIMLVLLVIFMVTATYITRRSIDVNLPEGSSGREQGDAAHAVAIVVSAGGRLWLDDEETSIEDLRRRIPPLLEERPDLEVRVDGDRRVEYGRVMEVIDVLRGLGVKNFAATVDHREGE